MQSRRSGDQDNPLVPPHLRTRGFDRDLIRGGHYGQRSREPHLKAEHMAAPTNAANVKKALANPEPSTHGSKAAVRGHVRSWSAEWPCYTVGLRSPFRTFRKWRP